MSSNDNVPAAAIPADVMTTTEAALRLGINRRVVVEKINAGLLATTTLPGGNKRLYVRQQDLEHFARRFGHTLRDID